MGLIEAVEAILGSVFVLGLLPFLMHRVERALDQPGSSPAPRTAPHYVRNTDAANEI